jgi:segregation and condensation protein B
MKPLLEAILLMSAEPIPTAELAEAAEAAEADVRAALEALAGEYDEAGHGFALRETGAGWSLTTRPELHDALARWAVSGQQGRLSQAGLETLAVVAYLQPVARSRVSAVRGVNVDTAVRTLLARGLVEEDGADDQTGAALLRTTDKFLERLGLRSLDELPQVAPHLPDAAALEAELAGLA